MCKDCSELEGFQLTNAVVEIGEQAFENCSSLSTVVMKNGVKKIGELAFANCKNLRSIKIPSNVKNIADNAFDGCDKAVFYCEEKSFAESYAKEHGFKVINMELK